MIRRRGITGGFRPAYAAALLLLFAPACFAQLPGIISQPLPGGGQNWSLPVQTLVFLTSLTFIPAALLMMTSFTRIIIVLGLLRSAIGTPSAPPNQVLLGLALFLTFFVMSPVLDSIYTDAYLPLSENKISMQTALERGSQPLRAFMLPDAGSGSGIVRPPGQRAAPGGAGGGTDAHSAAGLCHQRTENGLPDRLYTVYSVFDYRFGGGLGAHGAGDDDGTAGDYLTTVQNNAFRVSGWLATVDQFASAKFL